MELTELLIYAALALSVFAISFSSLAASAHFVFAGIRMLLGVPSNLQFAIAGRAVLPLIALGLWIIAQLAGADLWMQIAILAALILPIAIPLLDLVWRNRTSSLLLATTCAIAFPVVLAYSIHSMFYESGKLPDFNAQGPRTEFYVFREDALPERDLAPLLGLPAARRTEEKDWSAQEWNAQRAIAWLDQTIDIITFGVFHRLGYYIGGYRVAPDEAPGTDKATPREVPVPAKLLMWVFETAYAGLFWATAVFLLTAGFKVLSDRVTGSNEV